MLKQAASNLAMDGKLLCTTLYIFLVILYRAYTGARENDFTTRGYSNPALSLTSLIFSGAFAIILPAYSTIPAASRGPW